MLANLVKIAAVPFALAIVLAAYHLWGPRGAQVWLLNDGDTPVTVTRINDCNLTQALPVGEPESTRGIPKIDVSTRWFMNEIVVHYVSGEQHRSARFAVGDDFSECRFNLRIRGAGATISPCLRSERLDFD